MKARVSATIQKIARDKIEQYQIDNNISSFSAALELYILQSNIGQVPDELKQTQIRHVKEVNQINKKARGIMSNYK